MLTQDWSRFLTASIVPVALISACGLMCLAFYNRLAAVVSRLRSFQRERIEHHGWIVAHPTDVTATTLRHELLDVLQQQTASVTRRAQLLRCTLLSLLAAIACLVLCSMAAGLSVVVQQALWFAVFAFIAGTLLVLAAVIFAALEMRSALEPVELESRYISYLSQLVDG